MLHGTLVATITNIPSDINVVAIDETFAQDSNAPVLSFKAFRDPGTGAYRRSIRPTHTVVHPYFANLLPEGPLRDYLAKHAHVKPIRDFPLLWLLGNDLPGAIVLRDYNGNPTPPHEDERGEKDQPTTSNSFLRFSLAGVQLKFSATGTPQRGLTIPVNGMGGDWIVKLPDRRFENVPENEFSMMTFAREVGIEVPAIGLAKPGDIAGLPKDIRLAGNAYYVKRFDRTVNGGRVHTEDFAQANMLYPHEKYNRFNFDTLVEQVAALMGTDVALDLIRRIVFNIGIGNGEMHAKNWSIMYSDDHTPSLAPAYDYLSTIVYMPDDDLGMNLAETKTFAQIDDARLARLASRARLPRKPVLNAAHDMVARMHEVWPTLASSLPLEEEHRKMITAHMERIPLFASKAIS
jgi:serine/threonine-protein kinase HipA